MAAHTLLNTNNHILYMQERVANLIDKMPAGGIALHGTSRLRAKLIEKIIEGGPDGPFVEL